MRLIALLMLMEIVCGNEQSMNTENTLSLTENAKSPAARIEDVAWIAGSWQGSAFGGLAEEIWSLPRDGNMMGVYRHTKDGEITFFEILTISEYEGSLILRLKHFNRNLVGWEEKDEAILFALVQLTNDSAYFDGMTFRRLDENHITVFVRQQDQEGNTGELEFPYQRVTAE